MEEMERRGFAVGEASDQGQTCTVARGRPLDQDGHGEVPKDGLRIASDATFGLRRGESG